MSNRSQYLSQKSIKSSKDNTWAGNSQIIEGKDILSKMIAIYNADPHGFTNQEVPALQPQPEKPKEPKDDDDRTDTEQDN